MICLIDLPINLYVATLSSALIVNVEGDQTTF